MDKGGKWNCSAGCCKEDVRETLRGCDAGEETRGRDVPDSLKKWAIERTSIEGNGDGGEIREGAECFCENGEVAVMNVEGLAGLFEAEVVLPYLSTVAISIFRVFHILDKISVIAVG